MPIVRRECIEDLLPDTGLPPALIPAVDRLPGTEVLGDFPPGGARPDHPEQTGQDAAMVVGRPSRRWFLRWQDRRDPRPLLIGQAEITRGEDLDGGRADCGWDPCSSRRMT